MSDIIESNVVMVSKDPVDLMDIATKYGKNGWWVACILPWGNTVSGEPSQRWVNVLFQRHKPTDAA